MGDENSDYKWEPNRKNASELSSSEHKMDEKRKEMIRKGLEFSIIDVRSYAGYRGDMLIEFTTLEEETVLALKRTAESLGMEVAVRQDPLMIFQVYCISPSDDVYELKL